MIVLFIVIPSNQALTPLKRSLANAQQIVYSMYRHSALVELNTLRSQLLPLLPRSCDLCFEAVVSASLTRPFIIVLLFVVQFHEAAGVQG